MYPILLLHPVCMLIMADLNQKLLLHPCVPSPTLLKRETLSYISLYLNHNHLGERWTWNPSLFILSQMSGQQFEYGFDKTLVKWNTAKGFICCTFFLLVFLLSLYFPPIACTLNQLFLGLSLEARSQNWQCSGSCSVGDGTLSWSQVVQIINSKYSLS